MQTTVKLYSLGYQDIKTYFMATLFVVGNILLPQICHFFPQGGLTWLPIYFFTLIGAYKYGWRVGLLTAIASPLVNSAFFGMPGIAMLPIILLKSTLLAICASYVATKFKTVSILSLTGVVLAYQSIGTLGEWWMNGSLYTALQDFRIGFPGMLVQIFGGWLIIKYGIRK